MIEEQGIAGRDVPADAAAAPEPSGPRGTAAAAVQPQFSAEPAKVRHLPAAEEPAEDFASMLAGHEAGKPRISRGQKVKGRVIGVTRDAVFVDLGEKIDGIMDRKELGADGDTLVPGDELESWVASVSVGEIRLTLAMTGQGGVEALEEAREGGVPVEGTVVSQCNGGFTVSVMGRRAFCPGSQMEFAQDPGVHVGKTMPFLVTRVEQGGRNIVVSRRALVERDRKASLDELLDRLKPGDVAEGTVTRLLPYGIFVELAPGVEGLVHLSELSWGRVDAPDEVVSAGDAVRVKVLDIQRNAKGQVRFSLSRKKVESDPWAAVPDRLSPGSIVPGKVVRIVPYGAFVEVLPGVDGLVHVSEISWNRVTKVEEVLAAGDRVNVRIKEIDPVQKRVSLSIKEAEGDPWADAGTRFAPGTVVRGVVESGNAHGLFVTLAPGVTGLLPQSVIKGSRNGKRYAGLEPGQEATFAVHAIDPAQRRLGLAPVGDDGGAALPRDVDDSWKRQMPPAAPSIGDGALALALQKAMKKR